MYEQHTTHRDSSDSNSWSFAVDVSVKFTGPGCCGGSLALVWFARSTILDTPIQSGLLAVGADDGAPNELFEEASGRWFELPHPMAEPRRYCDAASLSAGALAAGAEPAAAAHGA